MGYKSDKEKSEIKKEARKIAKRRKAAMDIASVFGDQFGSRASCEPIGYMSNGKIYFKKEKVGDLNPDEYFDFAESVLKSLTED